MLILKSTVALVSTQEIKKVGTIIENLKASKVEEIF
jgi:hypothetical protein